jgi:hypothetical protein
MIAALRWMTAGGRARRSTNGTDTRCELFDGQIVAMARPRTGADARMQHLTTEFAHSALLVLSVRRLDFFPETHLVPLGQAPTERLSPASAGAKRLGNRLHHLNRWWINPGARQGLRA